MSGYYQFDPEHLNIRLFSEQAESEGLYQPHHHWKCDYNRAMCCSIYWPGDVWVGHDIIAVPGV